MLVAIIREERPIAPSADDVLEAHDELLFLTVPEDEDELQDATDPGARADLGVILQDDRAASAGGVGLASGRAGGTALRTIQLSQTVSANTGTPITSRAIPRAPTWSARYSGTWTRRRGTNKRGQQPRDALVGPQPRGLRRQARPSPVSGPITSPSTGNGPGPTCARCRGR